MPAALASSRMLSRSRSCSAMSSSSASLRPKKLVGGSCLGSPTMTVCRAARDGADRVPGGDLRGLVEDDDVEQRLVRRQILRDRQRRHQHAGREPGEACGHGADHLADRAARPLQLHLVAQQAELGIARHRLHRGEPMRDGADDARRRLGAHHGVDVAEVADGVLVLEAAEIAQHRVGVDGERQPPAPIGEPERRPASPPGGRARPRRPRPGGRARAPRPSVAPGTRTTSRARDGVDRPGPPGRP